MQSKFSRWSIAACAMMASGLTYAQATVKPDGVWRGALGAGLTFSDGNSKSTAFNLNGETVRATANDKARIYGTAIYGTVSGKVNANLGRLGGRYDYDLTPQVFGFGGIDFEYDKIAFLKLRVAPSVGLGYHVIKNANTTFDVFGGVGYVYDDYTKKLNNIDGKDRDHYGRPELLLGEQSTHKLSASTSLRQSFTIYPNLSNRGEFRSVFDAGLSVAMSSNLSLTLSLINRYNSDPGASIKKSDTLFITGISAKFE
jgi:putative salt-induced outer membrane protein